MTATGHPRLLDAGETALVVEFGDTIDAAINARVLALDAALSAQAIAGVLELVPTYRSLMIHYDPLVISRRALVAAMEQAECSTDAAAQPRLLWRLPACYDASIATDLAFVAQATGLSEEAVMRKHAQAHYRVVMYGFAPGWAYLSGLPPELTLPRRTAPRDLIPAGSLIIAGGLAIVAARPMPSGWHILGRTPVRLFNPGRDPTFLVAVGDVVTFEVVDLTSFASLEQRSAAGELLVRPEDLP